MSTNPRYMATVGTTRDSRIGELTREVDELDNLLGTFATPGWKRLQELMDEKATHTRARLTLPGGAESLAEIYAQRERLAILNWLLFLPVDTQDKMQIASEELFELRQGDER